jgi:hypothetical protein
MHLELIAQENQSLMGAMQMVCQELKYSDCEIKESTDAAW